MYQIAYNIRTVQLNIFINGYIGDGFDAFGDGNYFSLKKLNEILDENPNASELVVHINSGGGLVSEGFAIYDKLVSLNKPITTIVEGMCGSIATVIAQAGSRGKRKMFQNSDYFIHNPLWIPGGPDAHTADDLESLTNELRRNEDKLIDFYMKHTTANREDLANKMKVETTLSADEAKAMGFIDEVINTNVRNMVRYAIAAAVEVPTKQKQNTNTMSELKKDIKDGFDSIFNKLQDLISGGKKVNAYAVTNDGAKVYYDGNLGEGTKLFTDEAMTAPVADGEVIVDNKSYTVSGGVVTAVKDENQKSELEIANERIASLEAELVTAKTKETEAAKEVESIRAEAKKVNEEFVDFRNKIVTGGDSVFEVADVTGKDKPAKEPKTWQEKLVAYRKSEEEKAKQ